MISLEEMGKKAKHAARLMSLVVGDQKNFFLSHLAGELHRQEGRILAANQLDIKAGHKAGMSEALIDRLLLNEKRIAGMAVDLLSLIEMPDPVGQVIEQKRMDNGLQIRRQRVPLGVIAAIYEARPNVTVDISGLGIKSGNVVILRGGKETLTQQSDSGGNHSGKCTIL